MSSPLKIWHPFTNSALDPAPIEIARANGAWLYAKDGRKIIDAVSSWWVNIHGHGNARIAAAIAQQARKMEHVILAGFTHEPAEELASRLRKWVAPELTHLFFSDDGSTAVVYGATFYPSTIVKERATPVEAIGGKETGGIEIRLSHQQGFTVTGTVSGLPDEKQRSIATIMMRPFGRAGVSGPVPVICPTTQVIFCDFTNS